MNLVLVGLNHKTAPVEVRECLAAEGEAAEPRLGELASLEGVREALLISTCNRVEVLALAEEPAAAGAVADWLARGRVVGEDQVRQALYVHHGQEAVRHLFRVASSLDSLVVGEPQILGQIKEAYRAAAAAGTSRAVLNRLLHKTFQVAKRVRTETSIGGAAVSISFAAVELAKKIFDELAGLTVLLVGAGEMAELAAEHLMAQGVARTLVANRTLERAVELAERFAGAGAGAGRAFGLADLPEVLAEADIVITSTGSPAPVIGPETARRAVRRRRGRPVFFIDIAVPRDVETAVGGLDGCFLYDIDDLSQVVEANRQARQGEAARAERIVAEEVVKFGRWLESLEVVPTIAALNQKAEQIREAELARTLSDLELSPQEAAHLDSLTRAVVKKLLHDPIMFLKEGAHAKSSQTRREQLALVRRLFGLPEGRPPDEPPDRGGE